MALLATVCIGTPLFVGFYFDNLKYGLMASLSGMVILYLPKTGTITNRILTLFLFSLGLMGSLVFGFLFADNQIKSSIALGVFAFIVHLIIRYYKTPPPGSFFFILIASLVISQPVVFVSIPIKIGVFALGSLFSICLAALYIRKFQVKIASEGAESAHITLNSVKQANFWNAFVFGVFIFISMVLGNLMDLDNPYWIPVSCAAVMQGAALYNIWQRSFHRILGTFVGLGVCRLILNVIESTLVICVCIALLQFFVELLVSRHYAVAVVFITPLAILMNEVANPLANSPNALMMLRFWETVIGCVLGAIGGWLIHQKRKSK